MIEPQADARRKIGRHADGVTSISSGQQRWIGAIELGTFFGEVMMFIGTWVPSFEMANLADHFIVGEIGGADLGQLPFSLPGRWPDRIDTRPVDRRSFRFQTGPAPRRLPTQLADRRNGRDLSRSAPVSFAIFVHQLRRSASHIAHIEVPAHGQKTVDRRTPRRHCRFRVSERMIGPGKLEDFAHGHVRPLKPNTYSDPSGANAAIETWSERRVIWCQRPSGFIM